MVHNGTVFIILKITVPSQEHFKGYVLYTNFIQENQL